MFNASSKRNASPVPPASLDSQQAIEQVQQLLRKNRLSISVAGYRDSELSEWESDDLEGSEFRGYPLVSSTGWPQLDVIFPEGGLRQGMLLECLGQVQGGGVALLALWLARQMFTAESLPKRDSGNPKVRTGGVFVVFDNDGKLYPPAIAALGMSLEQVMIVTPQNKKDLYWALDQVLRCPAVSAVWSCLSKISSRDFRRLQLAAEAGRALGVLVRDEKFKKTPTWAHVRLLISALSSSNSESVFCQSGGGSEAGQSKHSKHLEDLNDPSPVVGDWCFRIERKRAVSAMAEGVSGKPECVVDLREVLQTSGLGQTVAASLGKRGLQVSEPEQLDLMSQANQIAPMNQVDVEV